MHADAFLLRPQWASFLALALVAAPAAAQEAAPGYRAPIGGPSAEQQDLVRELLVPACSGGSEPACSDLAMVLKAAAEQDSGDYHDTLELVVESSATRQPAVCELAQSLALELFAAPRGSAPREKEGRAFLAATCRGCGGSLCDEYQRRFGAFIPELGRSERFTGVALQIPGVAMMVAALLVPSFYKHDGVGRTAGVIGLGVAGLALTELGEAMSTRGLIRSARLDPDETPLPGWYWASAAAMATMVGIDTYAALDGQPFSTAMTVGTTGAAVAIGLSRWRLKKDIQRMAVIVAPARLPTPAAGSAPGVSLSLRY